MQERGLRHLPLVDDRGIVVDVVTLRDLVPEPPPGMRAVIMAGGFGTRLRPLTDDLPKPMLPVGGRPVMEWIVDQMRQAGIRHINVTTHYKPEKVVEHFGDGRDFGVELHYVSEDRPSGHRRRTGPHPSGVGAAARRQRRHPQPRRLPADARVPQRPPRGPDRRRQPARGRRPLRRRRVRGPGHPQPRGEAAPEHVRQRGHLPAPAHRLRARSVGRALQHDRSHPVAARRRARRSSASPYASTGSTSASTPTTARPRTTCENGRLTE